MSKKHKSDPHAAREAARYDNPVASREWILQHIEQAAQPLSRQDLEQALGVSTEAQIEGLRRRLRAMTRDAQLVCDHHGSYSLFNRDDLLEGTVIASQKGSGMIQTDNGEVFLSRREMRAVFPGDEVLVKMIHDSGRERLEGSIVEISKRNTLQLVGRLSQDHDSYFVTPDNHLINKKITVLPQDTQGARHGQYVLINMIQQPSAHTQAVAKVVRILGDALTVDVATDMAIRHFSLPHTWPKNLEQQAKELESVAVEHSEDRVDLRDLDLITIDGADARDFDDAVYCAADKTGFRLVVAIADVAHYIKPGSAIDQEAQARGTSVYFPQRVVPMLPEVLSNNLCSLVPNQDRYCLVCDLRVSQQGEIKNTQFYPATMHSKARLTYQQAHQILLEEHAELQQQFSSVLPNLYNLYAVYQALAKQRQRRGALDFETNETVIEFDDFGQVKQMHAAVRNEAHKLIEECMLAANQATAEFLLQQQTAALFRNHPEPKQEKINELRQFLSLRGIQLDGGETPNTRALNKALAQAKAISNDFAQTLQTMILRSLTQAVYEPDNLGHYGLAFASYVQFTSPIRRYPDLVAHRAIRHAIKARDGLVYDEATLNQLGQDCSFTERRAEDAGRDVVSNLKCAYMHDKVGETYPGVISGVIHFGFFVTINDLLIDGLVHVANLRDDYYYFDEKSQQLVGERSKMSFQMGDRVTIQVARVDVAERKIDFSLVDVK